MTSTRSLETDHPQRLRTVWIAVCVLPALGPLGVWLAYWRLEPGLPYWSITLLAIVWVAVLVVALRAVGKRYSADPVFNRQRRSSIPGAGGC